MAHWCLQGRQDNTRGKEWSLLQTVLERWIRVCKSMKSDSYLITQAKMSSKWITDFSVRATATKHREENLRVNLCDFQLGRIFLDRTQKAKGTKGRKKKQINWILPKLKICILQRMLSRRKRQSTDYDKICANQVSGKGLVYTIYKAPLQLNKNSIFKWTKNLNRQVSKKDIQVTNQHMKRTISQ